MTTRPIPKRHWRTYGTDPLPTPAEALAEPFAVFPRWFLRINCDRCGQQRMFSETHSAQRDMLIRDILYRMRHDGCGGRAAALKPRAGSMRRTSCSTRSPHADRDAAGVAGQAVISSARPRKGGLRPTGAQKEGRNQHGAALKVILSAAGTTNRRVILRAAGAKDYLGSNVRPGGCRLVCRHSIKHAPFRQRGTVRQYSFAGRRAP
jgi:hypothetical protein